LPFSFRRGGAGGVAARTAAVRESAANYATAAASAPLPPDYADEANNVGDIGSERNLLDLVEAHVAAQGFTFPPLAVRNYYVALKTKPFVILAGLSGTGKTRLTELLAEALVGPDAAEQYLLLPVRPDWTDPKRASGLP
jgi:hypothetical protein